MWIKPAEFSFLPHKLHYAGECVLATGSKAKIINHDLMLFCFDLRGQKRSWRISPPLPAYSLITQHRGSTTSRPRANLFLSRVTAHTRGRQLGLPRASLDGLLKTLLWQRRPETVQTESSEPLVMWLVELRPSQYLRDYRTLAEHSVNYLWS